MGIFFKDQRKKDIDGLEWPTDLRIIREQIEWPHIEEVRAFATDEGLYIRCEVGTDNTKIMRWYAEKLTEAADYIEGLDGKQKT